MEKVAGTDEYIPDFRSELFDISHIPDDEIKGALHTKAFLLLLKHIFDPRLFESLPRIFGLIEGFSKAKKGTEYLELFIRYLMATVESSKSGDLKREIAKTLKNGGAPMPSIAEALIKEGFEKGIEQTNLHVVEKMILNGISSEDIRKITGVTLHRIEEIRKKLRKK